jgi:CRISPR-associated protein (TIGR02710 family)
MNDSLDADYDALLPAFLALPAEPRATVDAYYRERLYPIAQARVRRDACPEVHTLFLTAGAQPWSVAHSLLATPARHVVFLCTPESQSSAEQAVQLAGLGAHVDRQYPRVDKADMSTVYAAVLHAYRALGEPTDVVVDVTSGTKAMTAASSSVAMILRARLRYIESELLRPGHFGHERVHELSHPLVVMGDLQRREAEQHFDKLAFDRAATLFDDLHARGAPDHLFAERAEISRAYADWDALRFSEAEKRLGAVLARVRSHRGIDPLRAQADRLTAQHGRLGELARNPSTVVFLRFLMSYARRREAQGLLDAAALVHYRSIEESVQARLREAHGIDPGAATPEAFARAAAGAGVEDLLAAYNAVATKPEHQLTALPEKVSLMIGWTLLRALRDPLTRSINTEQLTGRVEIRNRSVFAHGRATLARKDFDKLVAIATEVRTQYAALVGIELPSSDPEFDFISLA